MMVPGTQEQDLYHTGIIGGVGKKQERPRNFHQSKIPTWKIDQSGNCGHEMSYLSYDYMITYFALSDNVIISTISSGSLGNQSK